MSDTKTLQPQPPSENGASGNEKGGDDKGCGSGARPPIDEKLAQLLARRLQASLLPGEEYLAPEDVDEAARFVIASAICRAPGQTALAIGPLPGEAGDRYMRIAIVNEDMPFIVDSISMALSTRGLVIERLLHPVLPVLRDGKGEIADLPEADTPGTPHESMVYVETRAMDARARGMLAESLRSTLEEVRAAVNDWRAMQAAMYEDAQRLNAMDRGEGAALLRWFADGMLTQLGHVIHHRNGTMSSALGICRKGIDAILPLPLLDRAMEWFDHFMRSGGGGRLPLTIKSNRLSNVHRHVPLDLFLVPVVEAGQVTALSIHAGVWTSAALAAAPNHVPRIRAQLAALMDKFGFSTGGHAGKGLAHALTNLPHDQLIAFSDEELERLALTMMSLVDRPRARIALVAGPLKAQIFVFVWLPRDALSNAVRRSIADMLAVSARARVLDWSMGVDGSNLAQLRFVLAREEEADGTLPDEEALNSQLQSMLMGWIDAVEAELARGEAEGEAAVLATRYAHAFPLSYRGAYGPAEAAIDIARLRHLTDTPHPAKAGRSARFYRLPSDGEGRMRLKIYQIEGSLILSDAVPALENFGFRVVDTIPTELGAHEDALGNIHDFLLALPMGLTVKEAAGHAPIIEEALAAVLNAQGEDDPFNRMITSLGLAAKEANWLRAWYRYLRQAGLSYSIATVVDALQGAPQVTQGLVDLFRARHQPGLDDRQKAEFAAREAIRQGLASVSAINDDRLLRAFRAAVLAILRTNAFTPAADTALAFKFDSALVPGLPKPVPWREIFVYSRRVEGIHLRAGPVARGGIRWSDRRDDFRTEILGLMKAQRVKNAVIVPTGAKGGFYPKQLPDPARDREGWAAEGRASYQIFVIALLSVTDNIIKGKVVHPADVVIHDGDDPYFVVAADKGTATFSDTANAIAELHDFWLDDAFASGGSKGYDHKAMGITARGAWLSVRRHFLEMGVDVQQDPVEVVGVGDMSGDVFGNGMLLSNAIRLVAAFDHRHIFLDPDPDPAASWAERNRMFGLPRSSWDDYDKTLISKGGGVFPRSLKEIPLSEEVRAMLGIPTETIDPDSLISAILKAPVDLLWFGGIGTYVKGSHEVNAAVGDPANDALRVDARDLRVRVVGEGANLGCTQAARIEFALEGQSGQGGRINTDFIDNSAGVDCSDKEVNIKIALASAKRDGRLAEEARVELLAGMTDAVSELVLEDNRLQALGLSIAEAGGAEATSSNLRLVEMLEEGGHLDRRTEGLADSDSFTRRGMAGKGFTRPELAVLLSSTKLVLQEALERSTVPDDPALDEELIGAFPEAMREQFRQDILSHRLRREIIATRLANRIVNRLGFIHPFELAEEEGASLADVVSAFLAAEALFGMKPIWQSIEDADMAEAARILLFERAAIALRSHMADLLRAGATMQTPSQLREELAPGLIHLNEALEELLVSEARARSAAIRAEFLTCGAAPEETTMVVRLFDLDGAVGLARLAQASAMPAVKLTRAFTDLGSQLGLDWAQGMAARMSPADPWERLLVAGLARDFQQMRLDFLHRIVLVAPMAKGKGTRPDPVVGVEDWLAQHEAGVGQFRSMIARARAATAITPAMLAQIASQARNLLAR